jgi:hypothetical protein
VKYWEIIADNLSKAGWSWGCVSAIDSKGRTIWIKDAHRGDDQRFLVYADERLTAFLELASVFVCLDHITGFIENANHSIIRKWSSATRFRLRRL